MHNMILALQLIRYGSNLIGKSFKEYVLLTLKEFLNIKLKEIHQAAVQIAKHAANEDTIILGTVGGFRGVRQEDISLSTIQYHTELQIDTLIDEGVDALLFETYYDLDELTRIVTATRQNTIFQSSLNSPLQIRIT